MKVIELLKSKEWSGKVIDCVLRFALSFALALAQVFGGYAPLALGMIGASGAGLRGVSALIGASAGAVLFLPFSHALRTFAAGVLIFTANNAFFDLKLYKKRAFLPLLCAGMMFSVEFVYVLRDGVGEAANCLMALLLCALGAMSGRALLSTGDKEKEDHPYAPLFILLGVLMAASSFETADGFAPGRILSMLAVLLFAFERGSAFAIPAALCIGLGMDLGAGGGSFVHAASYAFSAVLVNVTARGNRVASALWFALSILCFALPMNAHAGLVLLYEGLAATLLFLLIPSRFLRGKRLCSDEAAQEDAAVRRKIAASAAALRELYDSIARPRTLTEENPAAIFDRAAEKVCRGCALCSYCWEKEYQRTYTALNDATAALLRRGQGRGEDFPSYFSERCIHFSSFLSAVNGELRAYLLRRQYRRLLEDDRAKAAKELGISQALLSHYENGIREPGLAFVKKACNYYHVSADYLLGRTLDRDGGMIDAESLYDSSDEKGTLRGSIAATLQKKMLVNTAGVLFELLGKTNDRTLITSAGSYLGGAFYQLYRALHRASGGKEGYFGLDATAYQSGAVDAQMRADYIAYVSSLAQLSEKDGAFASMEDEALASLYPGLMQSVTQVLHSTEEKTNSLLGRK